jgi:hypothetical protein
MDGPTGPTLEDRHADRFRAVLSEYLAGGDLPEAVAGFTAPVERAFRASGPDGESEVELLLWIAWGVVVDAVDALDEDDRVSVVRLLAAIQDLGPLTRDGGRDVCTVWADELVVHTDLPVLGPAVRVAWNVQPPDIPVPVWTRRNAFAAQLTAARPGSAAFNFAVYAIWVLRPALEGEDDDPSAGERDDRRRAAARHLPAVVEWFRHCGPVLAAHSREHRSCARRGSDPGALGPAAERSGLRETGFNPARWDFWRRRLQAVAADGGEAGGPARYALDLMAAVDAGVVDPS